MREAIMAAAQSTAPERVVASHRRRAVIASTVGTTVEWYDFFLYGTAAALVFPRLFFPGGSTYSGVLASFATQFVGFAARPIGAAVFGHFGDRIGRKSTLIATLLLMGIATFLIGLLPSHASIGLAAPLLLVLLRIVQGIGVGGEWGGSVLLSMEWGAQRRRGLMASFPQLGVPLGLLASTGAVRLMEAVSGDGFDTWGWRVPFLLSIVLVGIGLYVRLRVLESPAFAEVKKQQAVVGRPVWEVIRSQPREILTSALVRMSEQAPFYLFITFVLSLVFHDIQYGPQAALIAESFGTKLRYSGAGIGYQLASVVAGGPAPLIAAAILQHTGSSTWISGYIIGCCAVAFVALLFLPRQRESAPVTDYDAAVEGGAGATLEAGPTGITRQ